MWGGEGGEAGSGSTVLERERATWKIEWEELVQEREAAVRRERERGERQTEILMDGLRGKMEEKAREMTDCVALMRREVSSLLLANILWRGSCRSHRGHGRLKRWRGGAR